MTNNPNELTIENSALVLIDHQPAVGLAVHSIDQGLLATNVASLARAAKALGVPTVLTTIGAKGSILVDPIFKEISDAFPEVTPIDRTSTNAGSDPNFRAAIDATGRKKLIMAGIVTGTCLSQSVLAALKDGFEVYFVSDCSGDVSKEAHDDAKVLMTQAGARPIPLSEAEIAQIEKMEMREWHIKKLWNYYVRKALDEEVLPQAWRDELVPTKEMLKRDRAL